MASAEYTTAELAHAADMTVRNIRAYRQRGLLDPPRMRGRRGYYGPEHLSQLRTVRGLLSRGLSLSEISSAVLERGGQTARELLLAEPIEGERGEGLLAQITPSALETLTRHRPGIVGRLVERGIVQVDGAGQVVADTGLLARTNDLLAFGVRVGFIADVMEATGQVADEVGARLSEIASIDEGRDPRAYIDVATWSFREALRHSLIHPTSAEPPPAVSAPRR